jgi:inorganic triphosphatase YgiF
MEIELKLLGTGNALARLARTPAVAAAARGKPRSARLHAVYFDTPELDLQAQGIALRVRREGRAWIQCVKGPGGAVGGLHRRAELEWPIPGPTPQPALLDGTAFSRLFDRSRIRRSLAPVFTMEFLRRTVNLDLGGEAAAELAIDTGEIRAGRHKTAISEAEIELVRGQPEALLDFGLRLLEEVPLRLDHASKAARAYALLAPEPPGPMKALALELDPAAAAAAACEHIVQACLAQVHANEHGLLHGEDTEYLHQLRVGLRRLRVALALPREPDWRDGLAPQRDDLKWLSQVLGAARNWDVFAQELFPGLERECGGAALAPLRRRVAKERRAALQAAREAVKGPRYQRLWLALARLIVARSEAIAPGASTLEFARQVLLRRHHRLQQYAEPWALDSRTLHRVRIDAKKMRYASEFFASLWPRGKSRRFIQSLKRLQDALGYINDAAVARSLLGTALSQGEAPLEASPLALALQRIDARQAEARARLAPEWRRFAGCKPYWI